MTLDNTDIDPRMKPENASALRELQEIIQQNFREENERRSYDWFDDAKDISIWEYRDANPMIMKEFEKLMDIDDWDKLACALGLTYTDIEHCRKYNDLSPTKEVFRYLLDNIQNIHLSLKTVLMALKDLGQHQILCQVQWQQGIAKLKSSDKHLPKRENGKVKCTEYKPGCFTLTVTQPPEVLVNSENLGLTSISTTTTPGPDCGVVNCAKESRNERGITIMMIFAQDANEDARFVVRSLVGLKGEQGPVRVLQVTGDVTDFVAQALRRDPFNSILKWFHKVNFVVPILSPQFLRQTQNLENDDSGYNADQLYNRHVFRNMYDQYVTNGSINTRCRPLCPERYSKKMWRNKLVKSNGLLQLYWKCSTSEDVEKFAMLLMKEHQARQGHQ